MKSNTIRCKKLASIVSGQKIIARPFFRPKQVSTKPKCNSCYISLYFSTPAYLFWPEEGSCYVFSTWNNCCEFLASDGLFFKVLLNHYSELASASKQGWELPSIFICREVTSAVLLQQSIRYSAKITFTYLKEKQLSSGNSKWSVQRPIIVITGHSTYFLGYTLFILFKTSSLRLIRVTLWGCASLY